MGLSAELVANGVNRTMFSIVMVSAGSSLLLM